jgi:hypothetical protein
MISASYFFADLKGISAELIVGLLIEVLEGRTITHGENEGQYF